MATQESKVTVGQIMSAIVKYSNKDDLSCAYNISANVRIENGTAQSYESGEVSKRNSNDDNVLSATFNSYGDSSTNLSFYGLPEDEAKEILEVVYAFMSDVKESIQINPVIAE